MNSGLTLQRATQYVLLRQNKPARPPRRAFRCTASAILIATLGLLTTTTSGQATRARRVHPHTIVVGAPPGALNSILNEVLWTPFARSTRQRITTVAWSGTLPAPEHRTGKEPRGPALLLAADDVAAAGCHDGVFLTPAAGTSGDANLCAVPALSLDFALAWDTSRFHGKPDWTDFWDVARHPGKRGLRADPRGTLEAALLSDGVPPDALYRVLSTPDGIDRAFRRLTQLRPYVVWWNTPAEAMKILTTGAALMGMAATTDIFGINAATPEPGFGVSTFPLFRISYDWVLLPDTTSNGATSGTDAITALRTWITQPEQKQTLNARMPSAEDSTVNQATGHPPATIPHMPPAIPLNNAFWRDHLNVIQPRFSQWLSEH